MFETSPFSSVLYIQPEYVLYDIDIYIYGLEILGPGRCGTVAPVWLDMSTLVNLTSNTYSVDACVSWGFGDGGFDNFDCCLFTLPVKMKRCKQGFNVYYLGIYTRGQKSTHPKVVINFEKSDLSLK